MTLRLMHLPTLRLGVLAAVAAFIADQATKAWALSALWPPYSPGMEVLPMLNLRLDFNTGVTFGMFRAARRVLCGSSSRAASSSWESSCSGSGGPGRAPRPSGSASSSAALSATSLTGLTHAHDPHRPKPMPRTFVGALRLLPSVSPVLIAAGAGTWMRRT